MFQLSNLTPGNVSVEILRLARCGSRMVIIATLRRHRLAVDQKLVLDKDKTRVPS